MSIIPDYKNKIHTDSFNRKIHYGTESNYEKALRQCNKIYPKYKYLEEKNQHRKVLMITFTSKEKNLTKIQEIRETFIRFLITDSKIRNSYAYVWSIQLGKEQNNPHVHIMLWYDHLSYDRINLHYEKTLKKFNLKKERSPLTNQKKATSYILNEFSSRNKYMVYHYLIRRNTSNSYRKNIKYIGFSSFKYTDKIYKKSYILYKYNYLLTDKLFNNSRLIHWDKKYLIKTDKLHTFIIYLLLKYKNIVIKNTDYQKINTVNYNKYFTLSIKLNKRTLISREWQFPFVFVFS